MEEVIKLDEFQIADIKEEYERKKALKEKYERLWRENRESNLYKQKYYKFDGQFKELCLILDMLNYPKNLL